jgi:hypothetical protein
MTQFGTVGGNADTETFFLEAADPEELEALVNAALLAVDGNSRVTSSISLAGSGDGHSFTVLLETAPLDDVNGGLIGAINGISGTLVRCYLGSDPEALARAKTAAGVPPPAGGLVPFGVVDEQVAGAAKGQRVMGLTVFGASSVPLGGNDVRLLAVATTLQALGAGETILAFDALSMGTRFTLASPQEILYTGTSAIFAEIEASITVGLTADGDFTAEIVTDPLGTPSVVASTKGHVAAGEFDNVSVLGFVVLEPQVIASTKLGLRITSAAGSVLSASLRASA